MTIGDRIGIRRQAIDMTQAELARIVGYKDRSAIAQIERGNVDLPLSKVEAIAEALSISPARLCGWK